MLEKGLKGSEITIRCLEQLGVDTVFAYPGGQAIELHQALSRSSKIRVILPRHEQGGAFAAVGYARASGKVGVAMATSGPGATNLVSGIADAYMDSVPTVFITGQVSTRFIGKNVFQETDIIGVTRPIVKHSFLVLDISELADIMTRAFEIAASGRPGPVVVDIPKNIQQSVWDFDPESVYFRTAAPLAPQANDIAAFRKMLAQSERPCLCLGGGVISSGAAAEAVEFAEKFNLPVVTTLMGIGAIPDDHPLSLQWLGMHGTVGANYAANESDLFISLGARFDDRVTGNAEKFARNSKIIHVDIDDSEINKNKVADLGILADVKEVLKEMNSAPEFKERKEWFEKIRIWKKDHPFSYKEVPGRLHAQYVIKTLSEMTGGNAVIVPGVGQHQMWSAQFYDFQYPRQLLTSGGLGAMGFGLPAAMGAKAALPGKTVINIDGDGSFQMNIQELGTLVVEELDVKMVVINNMHLGMVAQWEDLFYNHRRGNTVLGRAKGGCPARQQQCGECDGTACSSAYPDFVTIASGYGIPGRHVWKKEELEEAVNEMLNTPGPFILDVHTPYECAVLPIIPPGGDYTQIITAE
ncbi:MAG: biosynthetic-type acetolactate synthase large subunit [Lentisphaerae bacterium]|nr:biosynthetic-type acetolactate synthase large subunit [Lentisphaerota bacterium]